MIISSEQTDFSKTIAKEKKLISSYNSFETGIRNSINTYMNEFKNVEFENKVLKTMLMNNFANAVFQADNNLLNIQSLENILDILAKQDEISESDIDTYNKLAKKVDTDIDLLQNFLSQTVSSFENTPIKGKKDSIAILNKCKEVFLQTSPVEKDTAVTSKEAKASKTSKTSKQSKTSKLKESTEVQKPVSKKIKKKFDITTSDLLCFFPKKPSDNLVISTSQENFKISFNNEVANISIEDENFNLSLKTPGVQISNSNTKNILFITHIDDKYTIITNNQIEIPPFIQVSKISKNDDFLEVEITSNCVSLFVKDNIINFENIGNANVNTIETSIYTQAPISSVSTATSPTSIKNTNYTLSETYTSEDTETNAIKQKSSKKNKNSVYEPIPLKEAADSVNSWNAPSVPNILKDEDITDNNTLIISDYNKNVILPYKVVDLNEKLKKSKKYKSLQDVIENEYTIPLEAFNNSTKSRFREAFQLMKQKEHGSLKEAIELGFELMFKSNLNPAVIAACRDLNELDIYLDCLDDDELDKFSCFNIQYDVPPTSKVKGKK